MLDTACQPPLPKIIQGGMGIGVSSWRLARRVASLGAFGVVSGTAIDTVLVRELQDGDPNGRLEVLKSYPDPEIVDFLRERYYLPAGRTVGRPYRLLPVHRFRPTRRSQRILSAATYSEVKLAKAGHDGLIGINLLTKLKRYTLASLYGGLLAGVDAVMMGAGIPIEESQQLDRLCAGHPARLRLEVDTSAAPEEDEPFYYELDPAHLVSHPTPLVRPMFFPIISSDVLARILKKKLGARHITGWIVEGPIAGGHNAPPRGKAYGENRTPIYDERDRVDLRRIAELGYPFYLAGGYGTRDGLARALQDGATGIQVGTLFSLACESGYPAALKANIVAAVHRGDVVIRTDGRVSSTGFPFKVVELGGTLAAKDLYAGRRRICDLGYLQTPVLDSQGRLQGRCPAEPVDTYVAKGGAEADTVGRACLCNGLTSNIGLGQDQKWGPELPLLTAGDELTSLPLGSTDHPYFDALDVLRYLLNGAL